MKTSESIKTIAPAFLTAQKTIGAAVKGSTNPFFHSTYADLGSVMEACKEALNDNGISVLQPIGSDENGVYVETVLLHESGEWIADSMRIAPKSTTNPQDQGSAISYARRYSLQSMVFIPSEDDDAESAVKPSRMIQSATPTPRTPINANPGLTGGNLPGYAVVNHGKEVPIQTKALDSLGQCKDCGKPNMIYPKSGKVGCSAFCWRK